VACTFLLCLQQATADSLSAYRDGGNLSAALLVLRSEKLILLDHSFEMLLKAGILHRGGLIRERRAKNTVGFDACVQRASNDGQIKFLSNEQALTLQLNNALRDAEQHYLLDIPEQQIYLAVRSGVTLFSDLLRSLFGEDVDAFLPDKNTWSTARNLYIE